MHRAISVHHTATIDSGVRIGAGTRIWHYVHVSGGAQIGENCVLGQNVMIGPGVKIGNGCRIQNNVSIYKGVTLEDDVFCGPSCVFTNVLTPRAFVDRKQELRATIVRRGASIGANATIVCAKQGAPREIGRYSMIAAGAVVTESVQQFALMTGIPARRTGWVSRTGEVLGTGLICPRDGSSYRVEQDQLIEVESEKP
jgi:UDP-2-acetamido-3-amino-2,3-dideoxy-glucuronate N-acetyltransferase